MNIDIGNKKTHIIFKKKYKIGLKRWNNDYNTYDKYTNDIVGRKIINLVLKIAYYHYYLSLHLLY